MISVENLSKSFGGVRAVDRASLTFPAGEITGLVGANGAGKTTLFNVIAGHYRPDEGNVFLKTDAHRKQDITGLPPHALFAKGILRTFQIAHEFSTLTALDNLMVVPPHPGDGILSSVFRSQAMLKREAEIKEKAWEVLHFLNIDHVADELAGNLSGGQKKLLELGRTMMAEPKIIFLDEVGAGVNRSLLRTIGEAIIRLNEERGYTFCMIEHDMEFITRLCKNVIVMAEGAVLAEGTPEEIKQNEAVIESYLGRGGKQKRHA